MNDKKIDIRAGSILQYSPDYGAKKTEAKIREIVGQALGEASMCWDPPPSSQVFDSTRASEIVERVTADLLRVVADAIDPRVR